MFSGKPTRIITAIVVCTQILSSLFLSIAIPVPSSLARASETCILLEASDLMLDDVDASEAEPLMEEGDESEVLDSGLEPETDGDLEPYYGEESVVEAWVPAECGSVSKTDGSYAADELRSQGVIYDGDYRYTWYSQRVLPGGGLEIEGRHVSDEGYVVDEDERIVVASSDLKCGTELDVPFGSGKAVVLDTGCASGTIDIYTDF